YLWIDAVCIDQTDLDEIEHQVAMMAEIYRSTTTFRVHLGGSFTKRPRLFEYWGANANIAGAAYRNDNRAPGIELEVLLDDFVRLIFRP
ncbi:hypothetical protein K458DRAFT_305011, partial [Lentithecium fluviatile CBS 122367]